jgi:transcriptional regulator with XRE-family HTH domain
MDIVSVFIGAKVQELREKIGLSQTELAKCIDVSRTSIVNMEAGRQSISIVKLFKISKRLEVSIAALLPTNLWFEENKNKKVRKVIKIEITEE